MSLQSPRTLLEALADRPPFLVFALARDPKRAGFGPMVRPPHSELVRRSGMPMRTFYRIAGKLSWDDVKVAEVDAFFKACGVEPLRRAKLKDYLKHTKKYRRPFAHLPDKAYERFKKKTEEWVRMRTTVSA